MASLTDSVLSSFGTNAANASMTSPMMPDFTDNAPGSQSTSSSDDQDDQRKSVLNYYFVFLGLFLAILAVAIFLLHRRKRRMKARLRANGQNALARDLDGWAGTRRWVHGGWIGGNRRAEHREEGLNELGEAPPPYAPRDDPPSLDQVERADPHSRRLHMQHDGNSASTLAIPLATLSPQGLASQKPPDYSESTRSISDSRPSSSRNG